MILYFKEIMDWVAGVGFFCFCVSMKEVVVVANIYVVSIYVPDTSLWTDSVISQTLYERLTMLFH